MATWDRYKSDTTGLETKSFLGDIFTIRSYCDDPLGGVFVAKEPVCKLLVSPLSTFINVDFNWDISDSVSSTGTLNTYDIDFDGATSGGDISGASWAGAKTGTNQYTAAGHYTIVASVTDTLGNKSKEVRIPVIAIEGGDEGTEQSLGRVYIPTTDSGCWIWTPTVAAVASNTGLSGDDLKFRQMKLSPYTADGDSAQHLLIAATKTGVAYSKDGAANWTVISKAALGDPKNDAGDGTPPVSADLDQVGISFDPQSSKRWYVTRTNATRTWQYWSDDSGANWDNEQVNILSFGGGSAVALTAAATFEMSHAELTTDKSIVLFQSPLLIARVIDVSGGSIVLGAASGSLGGSSSIGTVAGIDTVADKCAVAYNDNLDSDKGKILIMTVVTTTITQHAIVIFDSGVTDGEKMCVAVTTDGSAGCIAYLVGTTFKLCRFTISGTTITADSPVSHNTHPSTGRPVAMTAIDANTVLVWYAILNDTYWAQVVDVSSTISQGTPVARLGPLPQATGGTARPNTLTALSSTKAIVVFNTVVGASSDKSYMSTITISGTTVTFGPTVRIKPTADETHRSGIDTINSTTVITSWTENRVAPIPSGLRVKTFKILTVEAGDDIEESGSVLFETSPGLPQNFSAPIFTNDRAIIAYVDNSDTFGYALLADLFIPLTHSAGGIPGSILI